MNGSLKTWVALAVLATALIGGLLSQDRSIRARLTREEVEHVVDYKVYDRLGAIERSLAAIERKLAEKGQ